MRIGRCFVALLLTLTLGAAVGGEDGERIHNRFNWSVEASYPRLGLPELDAAVRGWVERHVADSMDGVKEGMVFPEEETDYESGWEMAMDYEVSRPSAGAISIAFTCFEFSRGAAHPHTSMHLLNIDPVTLKELTLEDMFQDPDRAVAIFSENSRRLINDFLSETHPEEFPDGLGDDAWFEEGFRPTRENYAAIGLEEGGVRIYFQQYQVLPYVFGIPEAFFPLSLLEPAGPNEKIWPKK